MGNGQGSSNVRDAVDELRDIRGSEYGEEAWKKSSEILWVLDTEKLAAARVLSPVASIVRKLVRAANDPEKAEHWKDMEVYVRLIREHMEKVGH